ncbi:MAG: hypothetical protein OEL84_00045 [Nitrosopumilus sp.]|nr:hypothetical protein [Nitrosopumilus sp.]
MNKDKKAVSSFSNNIFSFEYAFKSIKDIGKSMCRKKGHDWVLVPVKGYLAEDYYKCSKCYKKQKTIEWIREEIKK